MALNIKDEATDRLARELAAETGLTITQALHQAIVSELESVRRKKRLGSPSELANVIARGRARPSLDSRTADEILGFGPDGLPQ